MLYGINFKSDEKHNKGLKIDENLEVYFSNPVSSIKTAEMLEKIADGNLEFTVFELDDEMASKVNENKIAKSFEQFNDEFFDYVCSLLIQKLDELWVYNHLAGFKKRFESMSEKEQYEFMIESGLKFKPQEEAKEKE